MSATSLRRALPALLAALLLPLGGRAAAAVAEPPRVPVREILHELARTGVEVVWSDGLVGEGLESPRPDPALPAAEALEAVLAPHRLAAIPGRAGGFVVVARDDPAARGRLRVVVLTRRGAPVAGAEVLAAGRSATTDARGAARLDDLPPGALAVEVRHAGYAIEQGIGSRIPAGGEATLEVRLQAVPETHAAIVVTPSRYTLLGDAALPVSGRSREELRITPHLGDDPLRVAGRLPGTASNDFASPFAVRGGEPREVAIRLDGLELERPYHLPDLQALFSALDSAIVGTMELHTGGYPVELGGRLSGVLDVTTRTPAARGPLELGVSLLAAHALAGGAGDSGVRWLASLRRGYLDLIVPNVDTGGDLEPTYADLFAKVEWPVGVRALLRVEALALDDRERFTGDREGDERLEGEADSAALWASLDRGFGDQGWFRLLLAGTRRTSGAKGYVAFGDSVSDDWRRGEESFLRLDASAGLGERNELRAGFEARHAAASYRHDSLRIIDDPILLATGLPMRTERHARLAPSGEAWSGYAADRLRLGPRVAAEVGLRFERWSWTGDDRLSPRLHLVWSPTPALDLRAAWGRFAQPRAIDELEVGDGVTLFPRSETAEHRILALEGRPGQRSRLRLELYEKLYDDVAPRFENLFDPIQLFPSLEEDRVRVDSERGRARGVEISYLRRGGRATFDLSYAWSRAEDRVEGRWERRRLDQEHAVTGALSLPLGARWTLTLSGLYHSGWPTTDVRLERVAGPDGEPRLVSRLGPRNAERYPAYHRADLRLARRFETRRGELELALDLYNLYSRDNVCCVEDFELSSGPGGTPILTRVYDTWLPLVPSFGITWRRD